MALLASLPAAARADWTVQYGNSAHNVGISVASDNAGHVFAGGSTVAGLFSQSSLGGEDGYVAKFDSSGTLQWSQLFGTAGPDAVFGVAAMGAGSVAAGGYTGGSLSGYTTAGGYDAMVRLYDATGATAWTRQFGTDSQDEVRALAANGAGHLYVGGNTFGSFSGFTNAGQSDFFVTQLDVTTGAVNWTFQLGSSGNDFGLSLATDSAGNVYLSGLAGGTLPGQSTAGGNDAFVLKLDVSGALLWTQQFGSTGSEVGSSVRVDSTGAVLTAGYTNGTLIGQTTAGGYDAFVEKRDANGNLIWTRQFGTVGDDIAPGVAVNGADQAIVGGYTTGAFAGETNAGGVDAFVRVFSSGGGVDFTDQFGGPGDDSTLGVATDSLGNAYLAGYTNGALPGQTSAGGNDAFLIQTAVPEPTTAALLALGLLALSARRRRVG